MSANTDPPVRAGTYEGQGDIDLDGFEIIDSESPNVSILFTQGGEVKILNADLRLAADILATDGEKVWDESQDKVPASSVDDSVGSVWNEGIAPNFAGGN